MTHVQDSLGNISKFIYEAIEGGIMLTVVDAQGGKTIKEYDEVGNLISYVDRNGNRDRFFYDNCSGLVKTIDPQGNITKFNNSNECEGQCHASITDTTGNVYRFECDGEKKSMTVTTPEGLDATIHNAPSGLTSSITDYKGSTTRFEYNLHGDLTRISNPSGTEAKIKYDVLGRTIETNYEDTILWRFFYDEPGRLARIEGPSGYLHRFFYDDMGRLSESENAKGYSRKIKYNEAGQVVKLANEAENEMSFKYNSNEKCISITDARGNTKEQYFDSLNRLSRIVAPDGSQKSYRYDLAGNIIRITNPDGNEFRIVYDKLYRPIKLIRPNGDATSIRYNSAGKKISIKFPNNQSKYFQYDHFNRRIGITKPSGLHLQYRYNALGQFSELIDEAGRSTHFSYDTNGNVIKEIDIYGNKREYEYDDFGRVVNFKNESGNIRHLKYDSLGRLTEVIQRDGDSGNIIKELKFRYDVLGFCIRTEISDGYIACKYDEVGNLIEVKDSYSNKTIKYSYDENGNRKALFLDDEKTLSYTFDSMNRVMSIENLWGEIFNFEYNVNGLKSKLTYPNGVVAHYGYDSVLRLTKIIYKDGKGKILLELKYKYDCMNNITEMTENGQALNLTTMIPIDWSKYTQPDKKTISYKYDVAGNRIDRKVSGQKEESYVYNQFDQLLEAGSSTYGYDRLGNLISISEKGQKTHFHYDPNDMLTRVILANSREINYKYDAVGRRFTKSDGQSTTYYLYDLNDLLCILDNQKAVKSFITHGPGIDAPLAVRESNKSYFYLTDIIGSVRLVTDKAGKIIEELKYEPYGKTIGIDQGIALPYRFSGRVYDMETGLYYFRNRYYLPTAGRFIQKDPIEYLSTTSNYYAYASNNPVSRTDPLGLFEGAAEWFRSDNCRPR